MPLTVLYGRGDYMLKKKINGSWQNTSMLKKKVNGAWSDCSFAQKKYNGAWSFVWAKPLIFTSSSRYATINPPTVTKLDVPSDYYSFYNPISDEMHTTYFANAGDTIAINLRLWATRPDLHELYTHSGVYFIGSTFYENFSYVLQGGSNGGGTSGTFTTTATSTGQGTLTIRFENDNPKSGGSRNYGYVYIGNITIGGLRVYTCDT